MTSVRASTQPATNKARRVPLYAVHCYNDFRPPIALGLIVANLKINYPHLRSEVNYSPGYVGSVGELWERYKEHGPGIFLFSDYNWNIGAHLELSRRLKELDDRCFIIHGGPSVPRYDPVCGEFLHAHPYVDVASHGEGETTAAELVEQFLGGGEVGRVAGVSFARGGELIRNPPRERQKELDYFPSPYLTGEFDGFVESHTPPAVTLETNRGCPYGCTFCDWGQATLQRIHTFSVERVKAELEWIGGHRIPVVELADANFGFFDRDVEIARHMCEVKERFGAPRELATNYAKNATSRVTEIVRLTREAGLVSQGILSIQTRNAETLEAVRRKNLTPEKYDGLLREFRAHKLPILTEIMLGLPGSTYSSFVSDLLWACDRNLGVYVHSTVLLPNSPMADPAYVEKYRIRTASNSRFTDAEFLASLKLKPLRGNQLVSTSTYSEQDFFRMIKLTAMFHMFQGESVLKYIMFYLRWDYGISQVAFLEDLRDTDLADYPVLAEFRDGQASPASTIAFEGEYDPLWRSVNSNGWPALYEDVERYICHKYQIPEDGALRMVYALQRFLMAYTGREIPQTLQLEFDYPSYFHDIIEGARGVKLTDYGAAELIVYDPLEVCRKKIKPDFYEPHVGHLELASRLTPTRIGFDIMEVTGRPPSTYSW